MQGDTLGNLLARIVELDARAEEEVMRAPVGGAVGTPYRARGSLWELGYHTGADLVAQSGTPVQACADSLIKFAGSSGGWGSAYGTHVIGETVIGGTRYRWVTGHMSKVSVTAGDRVREGALVGLSGATGHVTGPHVHFEVRKSPFRFGDDVDPLALISGTSLGTAPYAPKPNRGDPDSDGGLMGAVLNPVGAVADALNPLDEVQDALTKTLPLIAAGAMGVALVVLGLARTATRKAAA